MLRISNNPALVAANYCAELYKERDGIIHTVQELAISTETARYLVDYPRPSTAGTAQLCRQFYDLAYANQTANRTQRQQVGRIGGLMLVLTDIVDAQIDRPEVPIEMREHYLDKGIRTLLYGNSDHIQEGNPQQISFDLAQYLHKAVVHSDERNLFAKLFRDLVPDVKLQLTSTDQSEHMALAQRVGAACALLGVTSVEYVTQTELPQARAAAMCIGAYAEYLDHAYEMYEDINKDVPTYATLYLKEHGDTPANRRQAKNNLLDAGSDAYNKGLETLDNRQGAIYKATCLMLDIRYRLIKRISAFNPRRNTHV